MALVSGIAVKRVGEWFEWKLGLDDWAFRQWPNEALTVNNNTLTDLARQAEVKLVSDAVMFSMGYHAGIRKGKSLMLDEAMRG